MSESKNIFGKGRHTLIRGNSSSSENVSYRKIRFIRILGLGLGLCLLSLSFLLVSVHANPIIRITPKTLTNSTYSLGFSTYFGGTGWDQGQSIAVDSANNSYITGHTDSSTFPMKNAYNKTYGGGIDAFVAKFNATGSLVFSTFLGGSNSDFGTSIAVDNAGNSYVVGGTVSGNFPMMNAYNNSYRGGVDYKKRDSFID